nr:hypothetical protein [Tanacetum cinerariifolium]
MVVILEKSDAAEGFEQIIDFLSRSYINHALTVNPHVYICCIKQFWNTAVVKHSGDVTRLQALFDKKRIVITKEVVREILQFNDAKGQRFNFSKYIFESLVRNVDSSSKFYMVGKGFSGVETPLFETMLTVRDIAEEAGAQGDDVQEPAAEEVATNIVPPTLTSPSPSSPHVFDTCSALAHRVEVLENDKAAQQLEIVKLKAKVKKVEKINKVKSSKLRRLKKVGTSQRVKSSDDVENIIKSINETPAQKVGKRRKLSEEAQKADDLKKRLEIVQDEDDDVFVEATPLA